MHQLLADTQYAFRPLRSSPRFVFAVVPMLVVAINFVRTDRMTESIDSLTWVMAAVVLCALQCVARNLPVLRAASVDPTQTLRTK